jgi:tRNA(Ile)-lysidine synthase TilS/MesJ
MIHQGDIISYNKNSGFREVVLEELLNIYAEKSNVKLVKTAKQTIKNKSNKIAVSDTIDSESANILDILIHEKSDNLKKISPIVKEKNKTIIKPLYSFLDEEVLLYAKLRNLKFKAETTKSNNLSQFLKNLESKHPEVKRAVVNSYLKLYNKQ